MSSWLARIREAISSRSEGEGRADQEEDKEIMDDLVFIARILQVASEEAEALTILSKAEKDREEAEAVAEEDRKKEAETEESETKEADMEID